MGEIAINVVKWAAKIGFWSATVLAFIAVLNFIISGTQTVANQSVIGELIGIVQMWLPFNLNVVFAWLITAGGLFMTYKIARFAMHFGMRFINNN